jgi:hypothetical protein
MNKKKALAMSGIAAASLLMALPAFAATTPTTPSGTESSHVAKDGIHSSTTHKGNHQKITNATFGTVTSVNGSSFTITRKTRETTRTLTIGINSATVFKKNGQPDTSTDLAVGQRVVVMGVKDTSGNVADATSVTIMVRGAGHTASS